MKYLKKLGIAATAIMALAACLETGTASAQTLYTYTTGSGSNDVVAVGTELSSTLESGRSILLQNTVGSFGDTCTGSQIKGPVATNTGTDAGLSISSFLFTGCSHTTTVLANGSLEIKNIAGTTNGTVISKGARFTFKETVFNLSCIANTGAGTTIGTLTGAKSATGKATMDINGVITLENGCGDAIWTASYEVTSPVGLTVDG